MKKMYLIVAALMLVAALVGCTAQTAPAAPAAAAEAPATEAAPAAEAPAAEAPAEEAPAADKPIKIGFTALSLYTQFTQNMVDAMQKTATENGVELIVYDSNYEIDTQISQVEDFIVQGVDAIILNPVDADGLMTAANACAEAGIPLILVNSRINGDNYTCYVGSSDDQAGMLAGEFAVKAAAGEPKNVIILHGVMGQSTQILRGDGFKGAIEGSGLVIMEEQTGNWQRDEAMRLMEDWLLRHDDIDIVFAENDEMALGALEAIKADGRADRIKVIGVDAIDEAVQAVKDGTMAATIFQDAAGQGSQSVLAAIEVVKGGTVEKEIMIPFITIDATNVEEYFGAK